MTRHAFSTGLPTTVGANIVSRSTSRASRLVRPASRYSVWVRWDISLRYGPRTWPPPSATVAIIFSSSSSTMYSSSISLRSARNFSSAARFAPPGGCRYVPLIGFISTRPSSTLTCRSGVAPT